MPRNAPVCVATHARDPERPRQAADGLHLCYGCLNGMRRHLADLPWLYGEVVASMPTTRAAGGAPVSGTREHRLPVNLAAGELKGQIEYDLYAAATWVAADRNISLPADGRVTTVCAWLTVHAEWLAASDYAAEVRGVLAELVAGAYGVIDPQRRPLVLGPCVEVLDDEEPCDGTLRAAVLDVDDPRPSRIWCDTHPLELTPEQWFRFGRTYQVRLAQLQAAHQRMAS